MEEQIGTISHYYGKIGVGIIKLTAGLKVGDTVHIVGHSTDFTQQVDSIQIEHKNVENAKKGDDIGLKVSQKVHEGDKVFLVKP
jgi:putative protease